MINCNYYMMVQLPNGFIDEYGFETLEKAIDFQIKNKDCKFGSIKTRKILTNESTND